MKARTRDHLGELLKEQGLLDLPAVEVGVAEGRYSLQILSWGVPYLFLVDLWASSPGGYAELTSWSDEMHAQKLAAVYERLTPYPGQYKILRGWAHEMCHEIEDGTLGFCFLDASHDYKNVRQDLHDYWPKLVENGMMAGHDWPQPGVKEAVTEFAEEHDLAIHLLPVPGDPNDASFWLERKLMRTSSPR
jgi:hypothetical protein